MRPTKALDAAAVAAAYGWEDYTPEMADEVILARLLALNLERAGLVAPIAFIGHHQVSGGR